MFSVGILNLEQSQLCLGTIAGTILLLLRYKVQKLK